MISQAILKTNLQTNQSMRINHSSVHSGSHSLETLTRTICHNNLHISHVLEHIYLRPFEIALRTPKNDKFLPPPRKTNLAQGLMIASKKNINDNAYTSIHFESRGDYTIQKGENAAVSAQHRQNLLNLIKQVNKDNVIPFNNPAHHNIEDTLNNSRLPANRDYIAVPTRFELAICVCIYSEDAEMLKQTIAAINQNIISLVNSGVRQDSIGVFVFFDGIQKIHPTVVDYLSNIDNHNIDLKSASNIHTAPRDFSRISSLQQGSEERSELEKKFFDKYASRIVFNEQELEDRKERTFKNVWETYFRIKEIKETCVRLEDKANLEYHMLPPKAQEEFIELAKKERPDQLLNIDRLLLDITTRDKEKEKALCIKAINQTKNYCDIYINSRNDLAYLSMKRTIVHGYQEDNENRERYSRYDQNRPKQSRQMAESIEEINQQMRDTLVEERMIREIYSNTFFCVKYKNEGKLSSHNWFFNGFCKELKPKFVILMDVGLKAKENSIFTMYHHLKQNPKIGGVCGYMSLKIQRIDEQEELLEDEVDCLTNLCHKVVDIQRAQQVEYHFAHLLDKPFEAVFKFIHVLPGAFSGYSMRAVCPIQDTEQKTLGKYFESLTEKLPQNRIIETVLTLKWILLKIFLPDVINSCFLKVEPDSEEQLLCNENMNMAEDRILCFGIHKNGFDLAFLPDAYSQVDPIKYLHSLYGQRRRWINGSYFAFEKVKEDLAEHARQVGGCEIMLKLQMLYLSLVNAVSYFSVSLFFFTFHISMRAFYSDVLLPLFSKTLQTNQVIPFFINTMDFIYVMFIISAIFCSLNLTYTNKHFKRFIYLSSTILGIFSLIVAIVLIVDLSRGFQDSGASFIQVNDVESPTLNMQLLTTILRYIIVSMFVLHAVPVIIHTILYRKSNVVVEIVIGVVSFLFYNPTYLITLNIYALCRMDDISWGTKGRDEDVGGRSKLKEKWRKLKFVHVFKYLVWNTALTCLFLHIEYSYLVRIIVTLCIMSLITFIIAAKLFLGLLYTFFYKIQAKTVKMLTFNNPRYNSPITERLVDLLGNEADKLKTNITTLTTTDG